VGEVVIVGIDPGLTGAVAVLSDDGTIVQTLAMPVLDGRVSGWTLIADGLNCINVHERGVPLVVIEEAEVRSVHQGVTSAFTTGVNYGVLLGTFELEDWPVEIVRSTVWTRDMKVQLSPEERKTSKATRLRKERSVAMCDSLWPQHREMWRGPRGGSLDGIADALLIAEWGRRVRNLRNGAS
jgi:crossover junction endodeoxyribonuclease RuvC